MSNLNRLPKNALQLKLGHDTIDVADAVRVLGVFVTPDLCLDKYVTAVSAKCFFQLRQLRRVRRSLHDESVATLVHAFVTSRIDYCNGLLADCRETIMFTPNTDRFLSDFSLWMLQCYCDFVSTLSCACLYPLGLHCESFEHGRSCCFFP